MVTQKMIHSVLQLKSVVGVQSYFSGSTWLGQIPKFFQKLDLKAPLTEIPKHWFNSQRVLLVLQDLFRNRKLKLLKFAARCSLFSCLCSKRQKNCVLALAILSHLICKMASWIGLEILIPKHP